MLRCSARCLQLQRQHFAGGIAYSAAFADRTEHDASPYQQATALYSPAATHIRRRKWHVERQKKYEAKHKLMGAMARGELGMIK